MVRLTIMQRIKMIKTYYKNGVSATAKYRVLRGDYGFHNCLTMQAIGKIVKKFKETVEVTSMEYFLCIIVLRDKLKICVVSESVAEGPKESIPHRSQELGLSCGTLWHTLHLDLHLYSYKAQLTQKLMPADHSQSRRYVEWVLEQQALDGNFSKKNFFSVEAHFTLGGYVTSSSN